MTEPGWPVAGPAAATLRVAEPVTEPGSLAAEPVTARGWLAAEPVEEPQSLAGWFQNQCRHLAGWWPNQHGWWQDLAGGSTNGRAWWQNLAGGRTKCGTHGRTRPVAGPGKGTEPGRPQNQGPDPGLDRDPGGPARGRPRARPGMPGGRTSQRRDGVWLACGSTGDRAPRAVGGTRDRTWPVRGDPAPDTGRPWYSSRATTLLAGGRTWWAAIGRANVVADPGAAARWRVAGPVRGPG